MAFEIPKILSLTSSFSSLLFMILVWIIIHKTLSYTKLTKEERWKFSILTLTGLVFWYSLVYFLGRNGFFSRNPLFAPGILIGFLIIFEILRRVYFSQKIRSVTDLIPQHWIILVQFYRIVGYEFIALYHQGLLPAAFAYSAGIGDMIIGFSAPIVALLYYLKKPYSKKLAVVWNILGIIDLALAIGIGFVGFPRPVQFVPLTPSTEQLSLIPLVLVPLFAVPLAILLHLFSLRTILKKDKKNK